MLIQCFNVLILSNLNALKRGISHRYIRFYLYYRHILLKKTGQNFTAGCRRHIQTSAASLKANPYLLNSCSKTIFQQSRKIYIDITGIQSRMMSKKGEESKTRGQAALAERGN